MKHIALAGLAATALAAPLTTTFATSAQAEDAICYNCPPQWADWASMLEAIETEIGVSLPHDNKNSGQTFAQLVAERKTRSRMLPIMASPPASRRAKKGWLRPISLWVLTKSPKG